MNKIKSSAKEKKKFFYRRESAEDFIIEIVARILKGFRKFRFKKKYLKSNKIADVLCKMIWLCLDLRELIRNQVKPVIKNHQILNSSKKIILDFSKRKQKKRSNKRHLIKSFCKVAIKANLLKLVVGLRSLNLLFEDDPSFQNFDKELLTMWTNLKEKCLKKRGRVVIRKK